MLESRISNSAAVPNFRSRLCTYEHVLLLHAVPNCAANVHQQSRVCNRHNLLWFAISGHAAHSLDESPLCTVYHLLLVPVSNTSPIIDVRSAVHFTDNLLCLFSVSINAVDDDIRCSLFVTH